MEPESQITYQDRNESSAPVTIESAATGFLIGGNLIAIVRAVGWTCPSFAGAILFIKAIDTLIGQIDGALSQLRRSGCLEGLKGVAVGQFIRSAEPQRGKWSFIEVLGSQLDELDVPVLGGLPIGHGPFPLYDSARNAGDTGYGGSNAYDRDRRSLKCMPHPGSAQPKCPPFAHASLRPGRVESFSPPASNSASGPFGIGGFQFGYAAI
jgi:hypothetical protein